MLLATFVRVPNIENDPRSLGSGFRVVLLGAYELLAVYLNVYETIRCKFYRSSVPTFVCPLQGERGMDAKAEATREYCQYFTPKVVVF